MKGAPNSCSQGFTLLELLLALAVLGMITVALVSTMSLGKRVWERTESLQVSEYALARNRLRLLLESAPLPKGENDAEAVFGGDEYGIRFLSFPLGSEYWAGVPVSVTVTKTESNTGFELLITESGEGLDLRNSIEKTRSFGLNFLKIEFSYFGQKTGSEERVWGKTWRDIRALPELIRIELVDGSGFEHPPIILQPAHGARQKLISASSFLPPG